MHEIYKSVRDVLCEVLGLHPDDVTASTPLQALTPTEWGTILIRCERVFSITLHDEQVCDWHSAGDLMHAIEACLNDGPLAYQQPNDVQREAWYYA